MSRNYFLFIFLIIFVCILKLNLSDGFRLRDLADVGKDVENKLLTKNKYVFRDVPFKKIVKIVQIDDDDDDLLNDDDDDEEEVVVDNDEDDDEDDDDEDDDDEDDDDDDEDEDDEEDDDDVGESEEKYVFQKVRQRQSKHLIKDDDETNNENDEDDDDNDDDDDDDDDDDEETGDVEQYNKKSIYNFFGLFDKISDFGKVETEKEDDNDGDDDDDDEDEDEEKKIGWFSKLKSKWLSKDDDDEVIQSTDTNEVETRSWKSYFNRKPFNLLFDFDDDDDDDDDHSDNKEDDDDDDDDDEEEDIMSKKSHQKAPVSMEKLLKIDLKTLLTKDKSTPQRDERKSYFEPKLEQKSFFEPKRDVKPETVKPEILFEVKQKVIPEIKPKIVAEIVKPEIIKTPEVKPEIKAPSKPEIKETKQSKPKTHTQISIEKFDNMLLNLPSFVPNYTGIHNIECKSQGQIFQRQLRGQKHWALQMMDASAKIPSGILRGNVNQLGDFDLCTDIVSRIKVSENQSIRMKGKYCLAQVDIIAIANDLKLPVHLLQGRSFLRSSLRDPSHFLPRFTTFNWGICLPSACTHLDAEKIIRDGVKPYNSTGIRITIHVHEDSCFVKHRINYLHLLKDNWQILATIGYYTFIVVLVLLASMNDYWMDWKLKGDKKKVEEINNKQEESDNKKNEADENGIINQILMSFSIKKTGQELLRKEMNDENEIECIHGIKAIGMIALYIALKLIPLARVPFTNRIYFTELFNSPFSVFIRAAFLYSDIFLLVSGLLTAYGMSKDLTKRGHIPFIRRFLGRIIRITPPLLAVLLFYAWIWEHIGSGPIWGDLIKQNADICKVNLWQNLLQIQNWFKIDENCATHTYQLAVTMQFYLISPLIVWLIHRSPFMGFGLFGVIHGVSAAMRYATTLNNRLSPVIFHGMKLSQFYRTADLSFAAPIHRATPFFIGIGLGIILSQLKRDTRLSKGTLISGWMATIWSIIWCFYSQSHLSLKDYQYNPIESAAYNAWASLIWTLSLSWIIYVCYTGNGWKLNVLLGSRIMRFLNRISYSVFLIEFIIFFYHIGVMRNSQQFTLSTSLFDWVEILWTLGVATLMTLMFDLPFQNIKTMIVSSAEIRPITNDEQINVDKVIDDEQQEIITSPFEEDEGNFVEKWVPNHKIADKVEKSIWSDEKGEGDEEDVDIDYDDEDEDEEEDDVQPTEEIDDIWGKGADDEEEEEEIEQQSRFKRRIIR